MPSSWIWSTDIKRSRSGFAELDRDGPGVLQSMKAEFILLADDLTGTIDRLVLSIDEHFQAKENSRLPTGAAARHRRAKAPDSDVGRKGA